MKTYRIICKRKHSLYERVEAIGCIDPTTGAEQRFSEDEAIRHIESGTACFFVRDEKGHEAPIEVEERNGRKFLITRRDRVTTDNLLALPECRSKPVVTPPIPPPRSVTPPRVHGFGGQYQIAEFNHLGTVYAPPLRDHYPQFTEIPVPPLSAAERAFVGTIQPFDKDSDVLKICSDLRLDRTLDVQAGRLRHSAKCPGPHPTDENDERLVGMTISFEMLVLQFPGGKHPQAYAIRPEVSRQRFPLHPHLRDDLDIFWGGRYRQSLCSYFAADDVCCSMIDFLDFTAIYLAKQLMWERTLQLIDRRENVVLRVSPPGASVFDMTEPRLGPEYSVRSIPTLRAYSSLINRRFGWAGIWPGMAAPHDPLSNLRLSPNSQCPCGSGKLYGVCHRKIDMQTVMLQAATRAAS